MKKRDKKAEKRLHKRREYKRLKRLRNPPSGYRKTNNILVTGVIDYYRKNGFRYKLKGKYSRILFPKVFSLIDNPDESLKAIEELVYSIYKNNTEKIFLDQSKVEKLDYGAEALVTTLALEGSKKMGIYIHGRFPENEEIKQIIMATGLPTFLGNSFSVNDTYLKFPVVHGRKVSEFDSPTKSAKREIIPGNFVQYLDKCLNQHNVMLTDDGFDYLAQLITATIENAEDHSGRKDWWVGGYMRKKSKLDYSDMHIAIFNFGDPISNTLKCLKKNSKLRKVIEEIITKNKKNGNFDNSYSEDELWTLLALQQRVSRNNNNQEIIEDNGQGTKDIIKFFETLGESGGSDVRPLMCLLSGSTHIIHDKSYQQRIIKNSKKNLGLTFNDENDLIKKPDQKNIKKIKRYFPGTLYSFRFYLNEDYLTKMANNE